MNTREVIGGEVRIGDIYSEDGEEWFRLIRAEAGEDEQGMTWIKLTGYELESGNEGFEIYPWSEELWILESEVGG